jgi:hypothetical protein
MAHATAFNIASLLDAYAAPKPVVVDLVRRQLLTEGEEERVRQAIRDQINGSRATHDRYSEWLSYSRIDVRSGSPPVVSLVERSMLQRALFDLKLGDHIRSVSLGHYFEIHEAREVIKCFFIEFSDLLRPADPSKLWWDGIDQANTKRGAWIPRALERDDAFLRIVESWVTDAQNLQESLDFFEYHTSVVNNPHRFNHPVFSEATATEVAAFMKVRQLFGPVLLYFH